MLAPKDLEDDDSDTDGDEEEDYQVFGRMTIKAQSEAFYQVRLQQKENAAPAFAKNTKKTVPKFMKRNTAPAPKTPANAQGVRRRGAGGDEIGHRHRKVPQKNR